MQGRLSTDLCAKSTISVVFNIGMSFIVLIYILLEHKQLKKGVVEFVSFFIQFNNNNFFLQIKKNSCIKNNMSMREMGVKRKGRKISKIWVSQGHYVKDLRGRVFCLML